MNAKTNPRIIESKIGFKRKKEAIKRAIITTIARTFLK